MCGKMQEKTCYNMQIKYNNLALDLLGLTFQEPKVYWELAALKMFPHWGASETSNFLSAIF